jgi:hypothetical protein
LQTPESYLGSERSDNFDASTTGNTFDGTRSYRYPSRLDPNTFALRGTWTVTAQSITAGPDAGIELSYNASDVYLDVGGTGTLRVTASGRTSTLTVAGAPNIYLVAHSGTPRTGLVEIKVSPGLTCYSFTFG